MPSVQSWFHTNLIICDLYWPLDRENAILDTSLQSRITSQLCNLQYLFSFLLLFPVWIYRIWQKKKIASLCDPPGIFFSFHSLVSCSYVSIYNAQNLFFSALKVSHSHVFHISQFTQSSVLMIFCLEHDSILFISFFLLWKLPCFSSMPPMPTEE